MPFSGSIEKIMKNKIWTGYILCLHIAILILFIFPNLLNKVYDKLGLWDYYSGHDYYKEFTWESYANRSKTLKKESNQLVFFGNSITNGLCVESLFNGVNMAVSGETINSAKRKIRTIKNLENKQIVVSFGINDIPRDNKKILRDYHDFISALPASSTIYLSSVLPIDEDVYLRKWKEPKTNRQINELNQHIKDYCRNKPNVIFIDASKYLNDSAGGDLDGKFHLGDGLHLNEAGNILWAKGLHEAIKPGQMNYVSKIEN